MKYKLIDPKTIPMIYEITTDEGYHGTVTIADVLGSTLPTFTRINYPDGPFETKMEILASLFIWGDQEKNFLKMNIENNFSKKTAT